MQLGTYKHTNGRDVAMEVVGSKRETGGWRVIVKFINVVNPKKHFYIRSGSSDRSVEFVKDAEVPNWRPFDAKF